MSAPLHLEYACTAAELEEAESLNLRRQLGGGSKWLTWLVLGLLLAGGLYVFNLQIGRSLPATYRPLAWVGLLGLFAFFHFRNRQAIKKRTTNPKLTQVELSETEITFVEGNAKSVKPWSAFSQCIESKNLFLLVDQNKTLLLIFPKRVFPDDNWQAWFRVQTSQFTQMMMSPRIENLNPATLTTRAGIRITVQLRFRDHLDATLASWRPRILIGLLGGLVISSTVYGATQASPNAVNSPSKVLLFELPFLLIMAAMVVFLPTLYRWRAHTKITGPEEIIFSDEAITFAGAEAAGVIPWTTAYTSFKETGRSFILWRQGTAAWLLLPKRQFQSDRDRQSFRTLLAQRLKPSRWFWG